MNEECYEPGRCDQAQGERRQYPEQRPLDAASAIGNAVACEGATLRRQIQPPEGESRNRAANTMKTGRNGSRAVRWAIQAPPIPNVKSRRGPTQQADAPIPASTPPNRAVFALIGDRIFKTLSMVTVHSVP